MGDGHSSKHNRAFFINNGIESEGWPHLQDIHVNDWSSGINRHNYWKENSFKPAFSYLVYKYSIGGEKKNLDPPFSIARLVFSGAILTDSAMTASIQPVKSKSRKGKPAPPWDEFIAGKKNKLGWLGKPIGPAVHLAEKAPDMLKGKGHPVGKKLLPHILLLNAIVKSHSKGLTISAKNNRDDISFIIKKIPVTSGDLTLVLRAEGSPMKDYPGEIAREMKATLLKDAKKLVGPELPSYGVCVRNKKEVQGIESQPGAKFAYKQKCEAANSAKEGFLLHPPGKNAKGYTWFSYKILIPEKGVLSFFTAMASAIAPEKSDGVTFIVVVEETAGGKTKFKKVFFHTQKTYNVVIPIKGIEGIKVFNEDNK